MPKADFSAYLIRGGNFVPSSIVRKFIDDFTNIINNLDDDNFVKFGITIDRFDSGANETPLTRDLVSSLGLPDDHLATNKDGGTSLISHGESTTTNVLGKFDTNITPDYNTPKIIFNINGVEKTSLSTSGWV